MHTFSRPRPDRRPAADQAEEPTPFAISRSSSLALWDNDSLTPITDWIGPDGEASPADEAVACVVQTPMGRWMALDLSDYPPVRLH